MEPRAFGTRRIAERQHKDTPSGVGICNDGVREGVVQHAACLALWGQTGLTPSITLVCGSGTFGEQRTPGAP